MTTSGHRSSGHRIERIAEEIRNEVSLMLAGELKDPRLSGPVTITEVRVTPDLRTARVYVSLIDEDEAERSKTLAERAAWGPGSPQKEAGSNSRRLIRAMYWDPYLAPIFRFR